RLPLLDQDNDRRREHACKYHGALAGVGDLRLLQDPTPARSVYHQLTVLTPRRAELTKHLKARGIGFAIHYPEPLHRLAALAPHLPQPPELPVAEQAAREVLSLPMFPELTDAERDETCAAVRSFYGVPE
ncbi:MAG TPA: DegT/DnrJ/EryC1/StrS family aminotransferase, partial [Thermoanaerobaculia bacterium]|nr:DegT/DnrJ/EryC1/StrS family aminotransferase [Thermoanaerobaculia bacterium]